jgi:hypothetical protein
MSRYCSLSTLASATSATASPTVSMADASRKLPLSFTRLAACGCSDTTKVRWPIAPNSGTNGARTFGAPAATTKSFAAAAASGLPNTGAASYC